MFFTLSRISLNSFGITNLLFCFLGNNLFLNKARNWNRVSQNLINFIKPKIEIISNVTAKPETNQEKIKKLLVEQIYSKVRWRESIQYMANNGVNEFIEIGPGKVLSGMLKRIVKNVEAKSINSEEDIKSISNEPKK